MQCVLAEMIILTFGSGDLRRYMNVAQVFSCIETCTYMYAPIYMYMYMYTSKCTCTCTVLYKKNCERGQNKGNVGGVYNANTHTK